MAQGADNKEPLAIACCLPPGWELRIEHIPAWGLPEQKDHIPDSFFYVITDKTESPPVPARCTVVGNVRPGEEETIVIRLFAEVRSAGARQRERRAKKVARARR